MYYYIEIAFVHQVHEDFIKMLYIVLKFWRKKMI